MTRSKTLHCVFERDKGMREVDVNEIIKNIKEMCIEANHFLSKDMKEVYDAAAVEEESPLGRQILGQLQENLQIAGEDMIPICQDTGMAVVFVKVEITVAPKGFGSENMSRVFMLKPADGIEGVKEAILTAVKDAGPNACPPMVVGVGIGGTFEKCAFLAKKALTRNLHEKPEKEYVRNLEEEMLEKINRLGIGPGGLGGTKTALAVNIETYPTHIAGLPVAVNICCHVNRHVTRTI